MTVKSLVLALCALFIASTFVACKPREKPAESAPATEPAASAEIPAPAPASKGTETMAMEKTDLTPGNGAEIKSGQTALVHYTGWLYDVGRAGEQGQEVRQLGRSQ
jgi:FKBP-type peptidyl-prolyl cis-trans isomerase